MNLPYPNLKNTSTIIRNRYFNLINDKHSNTTQLMSSDTQIMSNPWKDDDNLDEHVSYRSIVPVGTYDISVFRSGENIKNRKNVTFEVKPFKMVHIKNDGSVEYHKLNITQKDMEHVFRYREYTYGSIVYDDISRIQKISNNSIDDYSNDFYLLIEKNGIGREIKWN